MRILQDFEIQAHTLFFYNNAADNLINSVREIIRNKKYDFSKLVNFLNKAGIKLIIKKKQDISNKKGKTIYKNKKQYEFIQNRNSLENLDFYKIIKFIEKQQYTETKNNYQLALETAYAMCYVGKYDDAYRTYKQISENALKSKEFVFYALSEFNRYYVGRIIKNSLLYDKTLAEQVRKEIDKIELDKMLIKLPFNPEELDFIKTIISWNFVDSNKMLSINQKMDKDANTCYTWISKNSTGIYQFENYIKNFWNFLKFNLLAVDRYNEVKIVFYNYIDSMLKNYTIPKLYLNENDSFFGEKSENIKIENFSIFEIRCIIEYLNTKELENIFKRYEIKELPIKENELDQFMTVIQNSINFINNHSNCHSNININIIFLLLSVIKLTKEQYENINTYILNFLNNKFLNIEHYKYLNKYLYCQAEYFDNFDLNSSLKILLNILEEIKNPNSVYYNIYINIIHNITSYIHKNHKEFKLKNEELLNSLLKNTNTYMYSVLMKLYKILDSNHKKKINIHIKNKLNDSNYEKFHCEIYYISLMEKIIKPNAEYENKFCNFIERKKIEKEKTSIRTYPDPVETTLRWTNNLILNNYILNKENFEQFLGIIDDYDFLYDINKFSANKFKIEWLDNYSDSLIERLSQNKKIKSEIKNRIEKMILSESKVDNKLLKTYIKYFN